MAASDTDQNERTEEATQTRREEFRRHGQVAQTRELSSVLFVFAAALCILVLSQFLFGQISEIFENTFGDFLVAAARKGDYLGVLRFVLKKFAFISLPILAAAFIISFGSSVLQIGFLAVEDALSPNFDRIDPIEGFKRIFSMKALVDGLKATLKVSLVGLIVFLILKQEATKVPLLVYLGVNQLSSYIGMVITKLLGSIGLFMTVIAGLDYFFLRWDMEKKMRMTKQELKEEIKSREGDPLIKARIRRIQREVANRRMMADVPKADVVITNPTHLAVALKYSADLPAPKLLAKGSGLVAQKIRELAREHRVPIVENKPLARTIFKTMKIGQVIPRELYTAVAEVLSYVYRLKRKLKRR